MEPQDIVLFSRNLGRRSAGGARAVLQRAGLYARAGHRVHLVVMGDARGGDVAYLRKRGELDPAVRVLNFVEDAPGLPERAEAARHAPLDPERLVLGGEVTQVRVVEESTRRLITSVAGRPRTEEARTLDGATRLFVRFGDSGGRVEVWRYRTPGVVSSVDTLDETTGAVVERRYVVDGRYVWLTADLTVGEGRGRATLHAPGSPSGATTLYRVLAEWLDRQFADVAAPVVMADGENTWQHALRAMKHPGVRGVSILHNSHLAEPYDAGAPTKEHWVGYFETLRNVHAMVCLSQRQFAHLNERYDDLPLRIVHHAVPAPAASTVTRDPHRAVFVGRFAEQKRLDHLLRAWARVAEQLPAAHLDLYGAGTGETELVALVEELGIRSRVTFRGFTDDPAAAFASARVAVMTSLYEGLPLTLTEGMAVGTPFVAYDVNYGPSEVIRDGVDGVLVPVGDVEAFAAALIGVLKDDALAQRMSDASREVVERFSERRYAQAWTGLIDDLVPGRATSTQAAGVGPSVAVGHDGSR